MLKSDLNKRAVALKYDGDDIAPVVIATGMGKWLKNCGNSP